MTTVSYHAALNCPENVAQMKGLVISCDCEMNTYFARAFAKTYLFGERDTGYSLNAI